MRKTLGKPRAARYRTYQAIVTAALGCVSAPLANASQTKSFVVSWFNQAEYADPQGRDCPHGLNDEPAVFYHRELLQSGMPKRDVDKFVGEFLDFSKSKLTAPIAQMRGRVNGQPADAYANPESVPDPNLKLVEGPIGYGFNLDGKIKPGDFTDPETGEKGIDNQLYRVIGCIKETRTSPQYERPHLQLNYWNILYEQMPAWLVEISGIEDLQNSPDVTVTISRALEAPHKDTAGQVTTNLTFTSDPNRRWQNVVHGRIKDGVLTTDIFDMNMLGDPFWIQEFHLKQARLRAKIDENGNFKGIIGAYHAWFPFYWQYASEGWALEFADGIDLPGLYYALKKSADADPDPLTGQNRMISTAWVIEAVPAFVTHQADLRRAELGPATEGGSRGK